MTFHYAVRTFLAQTKQRLNYAAGWCSIFGMPLLIVDLIQKKLLLININISFWLLVIISMTGLWLSGFIAEKIGLIKAENDWSWSQQTYFEKRDK